MFDDKSFSQLSYSSSSYLFSAYYLRRVKVILLSKIILSINRGSKI